MTEELRAAERIQQAYAQYGPDSRRFMAEDCNVVSRALLNANRPDDDEPLAGCNEIADALGDPVYQIFASDNYEEFTVNVAVKIKTRRDLRTLAGLLGVGLKEGK